MKTQYASGRIWAAVMRKAYIGFCVLTICSGAMNLRAQVITGIGEIIPENEHLVKVNTLREFGFTEGCTWDGVSSLYFSDIANNKIIRYDMTSGSFADWAERTEGGNGTCLSHDGFLYVAEGGARWVAAYDRDGRRVRIVAESFNGKALNSPNDVCIDRKGGVYFSDPRYGGQHKNPRRPFPAVVHSRLLL